MCPIFLGLLVVFSLFFSLTAISADHNSLTEKSVPVGQELRRQGKKITMLFGGGEGRS